MDLPPTQDVTTTRTPIRALVHRHRGSLLAQTALSLIGGFAEAATMVTIFRIAYSVTQSDEAVDLGFRASQRTAILLALVALFTKIVTNLLSARATAHLTGRSLSGLRLDLLTAFFGTSYAAQSSLRRGTLQELVSNDADRAARVALQISTLIVAAGSFLVVTLVAVAVSPLAAAASTAIAVALVLLLRPLSRSVSRTFQALQVDRTRLGTSVSEATHLALEARTFGVREQLLASVREEHQRSEAAFLRGRFLMVLMPLLYQNAILLVGLGAAALATLSSPAAAAEIGTSLVLLLRSFSYGQIAQSAYNNISESVPSLNAVIKARDVFTAEAPDAGTIDIDQFYSMELEEVAFRYSETGATVGPFTLRINAGDSVAIMGPSGAGKTTLIGLLLGVIEPTSGSVTVNEHWLLRNISVSSWTREVAYVPQESRLIAGSIRDNIDFFRGLPEDRIANAARLSGIDSMIVDRGGLDATVGANAEMLSGGQRQRIAIARALAGDPKMLVLDEPTSSLDEESEAAIQENLSTLAGHLTLVVVTHRPSTARLCQRILAPDRHTGRWSLTANHDDTLATQA